MGETTSASLMEQVRTRHYWEQILRTLHARPQLHREQLIHHAFSIGPVRRANRRRKPDGGRTGMEVAINDMAMAGLIERDIDQEVDRPIPIWRVGLPLWQLTFEGWVIASQLVRGIG